MFGKLRQYKLHTSVSAKSFIVVGIRGLRGVESTCLPPVMWPAFNPGAGVRSGWSLSLVIAFALGFISGFSAWFPLQN